MIRRGLLLLCFIPISTAVYADLYEPVAQCYQPARPLWFATSYYKERYDKDVSQYRSCMKAFIANQRKAAEYHRKAAQKAVRLLDDFVNNE